MDEEDASETTLAADTQLPADAAQVDSTDADGAAQAQPQQAAVAPEDLPSIDIESLNRVLGMRFKPEATATPARKPEADATAGAGGLFEELAEDMLELLRRVTAIERAQGDLSLRLEQVETTLRDTARLYAREVDTLRRELLGERKALSALSVFNAVLPMLDSLRAMHARLHNAKDAPVRRQLDALIQTLSTTLRGLGFTEFEATKDEPFDPGRMECLGFTAGRPGVVLKVIRPGYRVQEIVVRPAGVMIADPARAAKASTEEL